MAKIRNKVLSGSILTFAVICAPVHATNLADVYQDAQANDPVLKGAAASYRAQKEVVPQSRSALLPNLGAGAGSTWSERSFPIPPVTDTDPSSPSFGQTFSIPDQEFNDHFWQAQLRQPLVNMPSWHTYKGSKEQAKAAKWNYQANAQALVLRVVQAYLNVLRAQDLLESASAEETAVKRQLEQVQQRFDVGLVAITDVLESQAVYDNSVVRKIQAEGDHDIFFQTLNTLTGTSYASLDRLAESLPVINPAPANEEQWVSTALETNYGIKSALAQLASSKRIQKARRAGHYPTIDATISHNHFVTGGQSVFGGSGIKTDTTVYGVELSLPIYQGGLTRSRTREARALADQAQQFLTEQQLNVDRDTRNLFRAVATDVVRVKARLKAIKSAESALEATETGYEVGTRNIVDVLQAQQRLFGSQFDYADSRYNYVTDLMALKQTAGTLSEADMAELNAYMDPKAPVERVIQLSTQPANLNTQ